MTRVAVAFVALVAVFAVSCSHRAEDHSQHRILTQDLRPYGYPDFVKVHDVSDYASLQFLSNDLMLIAITERQWPGPVEPLDTDEPPSKFLLLDLDQKKFVKAARYPAEKTDGSVRATTNGEFIILNQEGAHVCSAELICGRPFPTEGPIRMLPGGTRLLAGGNGQTEVDLPDALTLRVLSRPAPQNLSISLMGGVFLAPRGIGGLAMSEGQGEIINETTVASFDSTDERTIAIRRVDGDARYQIPVTDTYETKLTPNRSGSRFCALEESYTPWNSIVNFWDIDNARPHNFARVRIFDMASGKQLFEMNWDPRPSQTVPPPALSPDGHKLALIRHSQLEVFDIP